MLREKKESRRPRNDAENKEDISSAVFEFVKPVMKEQALASAEAEAREALRQRHTIPAKTEHKD